ncbi:hypothetical protein BURKHO8Y_320015 [Burkholderia sp. 8Y]|nr:hypothetical protein BURKHO8Y_320015 [Burkholderia sp. 8Y]
MSARQITLLREWGYPYVLDEYRFHMALSDSLDEAQARAFIMSDWSGRTEKLGPMPVQGAALFIEAEPGAPFMLWQRLPFKTSHRTSHEQGGQRKTDLCDGPFRGRQGLTARVCTRAHRRKRHVRASLYHARHCGG